MGKYKIKTHAGAKARFSISGSGKIMRRRIGRNNFRRKKRGETLREFSGKLPVAKADAARLRRLMPYA